MTGFFNNITNIQSRLKAPKNQYNDFGKYKYRSCEDILEGLKPLLAEYKLVQTIKDDVELIGDRYYIRATVTVTDGENSIVTSAYAREPLDKKGMDSSQITGTASSYARKYALNGMWNIDDTKDSDSNEYKQQEKKPSEALATNQELIDLYELSKNIGVDTQLVEEVERITGKKTMKGMTKKHYEQLVEWYTGKVANEQATL